MNDAPFQQLRCIKLSRNKSKPCCKFMLMLSSPSVITHRWFRETTLHQHFVSGRFEVKLMSGLLALD